MEQQDNTTEIYTLKDWRITETLDGFSVEGRLHGRAGFPDGVWISTSLIKDWSFEEDYVFFTTENSKYCCALNDYIFDGSLRLIFYCDKLPDQVKTYAE